MMTGRAAAPGRGVIRIRRRAVLDLPADLDPERKMSGFLLSSRARMSGTAASTFARSRSSVLPRGAA